MHDYDFAWGLAIHTRFDDLHHISRSWVCENHKLLILFSGSCPLYFNGVWLLHTLNIKRSKTIYMLCVTGLYLGDITNTIFVILHLIVSCLSVCSSCFIYVFIYFVLFSHQRHLQFIPFWEPALKNNQPPPKKNPKTTTHTHQVSLSEYHNEETFVVQTLHQPD